MLRRRAEVGCIALRCMRSVSGPHVIKLSSHYMGGVVAGPRIPAFEVSGGHGLSFVCITHSQHSSVAPVPVTLGADVSESRAATDADFDTLLASTPFSRWPQGQRLAVMPVAMTNSNRRKDADRRGRKGRRGGCHDELQGHT
jgi:hypothetical protein